MPEPPTLRLVEVPDAAPPYDCQIHGTRCPAHGTAPAGVAEAGEATVNATATGVPQAGVAEAAAGALSAVLARPVVAADSSAARPRQVALVIVEVLAGVRPDRQLASLATDRVRARVRSLAPLLSCDRRPRVARMMTSQPTAQVVEMTVVASFGPRSHALAMRFEHLPARPAAPGWSPHPARWLCTALEAG